MMQSSLMKKAQENVQFMNPDAVIDPMSTTHLATSQIYSIEANLTSYPDTN